MALGTVISAHGCLRSNSGKANAIAVEEGIMALHILNLERGLAPLSQTHELSFLFVLVIQDFVGKGLAQLSSTKSGKRSWGRGCTHAN